jgi:hypothetical protein
MLCFRVDGGQVQVSRTRKLEIHMDAYGVNQACEGAPVTQRRLLDLRNSRLPQIRSRNRNPLTANTQLVFRLHLAQKLGGVVGMKIPYKFHDAAEFSTELLECISFSIQLSQNIHNVFL